MTHPLAGHLEVDESAQTVRHYRYAVERMTRILGGWIALTPELSAKLLMGRHVWDNAQHADAWGKRLPELRAAAQVSEPANARLVGLPGRGRGRRGGPSRPSERVVAIYRVLKPHLLATYKAHLATANAVYEPPTCRILARCIEDERRHVAAGETVLRHLLRTPELRRARARLRGAALGAAGGGGRRDRDGPVSRVSAAGAPPARAERRRRRVHPARAATGAWPIAPALAPRRCAAFGDALVAGDVAAARRWLAPEVELGADSETRLARVAAVAHSSRRVRARSASSAWSSSASTAPTRSVALLLRWVPTGPEAGASPCSRPSPLPTAPPA